MDQTKFRVVDCGRQWGKTTLAVWEMIACAFSSKDKRIGYFATTYGQARDIAWVLLKELTRPMWAKDPNETRLEITIKTQDGGESEIILRGFESVETARGTQFDLLVLDEVSKMRNFKEGWQAVLLGTLAFRNGKALFISTPYGFNHFFDLYELGQGKHRDYKSWKFTSYENPFLSRDYLEGIKSTVTPDFWAQEYLGDFRRFTGLIYKEFDLLKHVDDFPHIKDQHGSYLFGQDFAVRGYTAALPLYISDKAEYYFLDNYKESNRTAQEHAPDIKIMLETYASFIKYTGYSDPAGWMKNQQRGDMIWSIADEYLEMGFPITQANNEVTPGINFVRQLFQQNKIHIHSRCTKLIDELLQYQWKDQPDTQIGIQSEPEEVRKIHDHLVDSMRYVLYSKPSIPEEAQPELPYKSGMLLEFPPWSQTNTQNPNQSVSINKDTFDRV
jgi:hypothetical protein